MIESTEKLFLIESVEHFIDWLRVSMLCTATPTRWKLILSFNLKRYEVEWEIVSQSASLTSNFGAHPTISLLLVMLQRECN